MQKRQSRIWGTAVVALLCASFPAAADQDIVVGAEAFHDDYREPIFPLHTRSRFLSLNGSLSLKETYYYIKFEGRLTAGQGDYASTSGSVKNMQQRETELRVLGGPTFQLENGGSLSPYLGLGGRYYFDNGNGKVSNLGARFYDRDITQLYVPLGVLWHTQGGGLAADVTAEYDHLVMGTVSSALTQIGKTHDAENKQYQGYGLRGGVLVGPSEGAWQLGPFVRYWNIRDSDIYNAPDHSFWTMEPANTRLQAGLEFLYHFGVD